MAQRYRAPMFCPQHPHGISLSLNSVPGDSTPSWWELHACTHAGSTFIQLKLYNLCLVEIEFYHFPLLNLPSFHKLVPSFFLTVSCMHAYACVCAFTNNIKLLNFICHVCDFRAVHFSLDKQYGNSSLGEVNSSSSH